jgi:hypothetical protein
VNQLDDTARETFATGRPLEDPLDTLQCKHCKKSILKPAVKGHVAACLKAKREKAQRKKEQKEARDREKRAAGKDDDKDEDGDTKMEDDDDDDDVSPDKKGPGGLKSAKKSAGKKVDLDEKKGKKRKAEGDAEKGPKQKKKKEEPKPKAPKQKGKLDTDPTFPSFFWSFCIGSGMRIFWFEVRLFTHYYAPRDRYKALSSGQAHEFDFVFIRRMLSLLLLCKVDDYLCLTLELALYQG